MKKRTIKNLHMDHTLENDKMQKLFDAMLKSFADYDKAARSKAVKRGLEARKLRLENEAKNERH